MKKVWLKMEKFALLP